jgi:ABC-2 type transport system permease protein
MFLATYTLWLRDVRRFYRQRGRIVGSVGSPIVFWLLIGSGLGQSFRAVPESALEHGYLEYFYPGTLALIVLFTAIFSTISVIEDRQAGFLQGVLVAPVPRSAIVLGKIFGGTTLALAQSAVFLLLAPLAGVRLPSPTIAEVLGVLAILGFALTGLGFLIAWTLDSTQGFHAIMNLLLIPMWILSGALFPASGAAAWVRAIMAANPLTYGVGALRRILLPELADGGPPLATSLLIMASFGTALLVAATLLVRRPRAA